MSTETGGPGLLIVGSSQAGVQLAVSLRALGYQPAITLLGDEDHRPYQRPALSKEFLQDTITKESLIFRTAEYWAEHRIDVVKGERIEQVRQGLDGAGTAFAASGRAFEFDRLALTVGARARVLDIEGSQLAGVLYLRKADDALQLKALVPDAANIVVIGGGFIGLEAAASLRTLGKSVTVLEAGPRLVGRAVGEVTSQFLLDHHRENGVDVRLNSQASRIIGADGQVTGVEVDHEVLPADIVLIGVGVLPNTDLAESMGLTCHDGIVVDEYATASDGTTMALGDCANLPNPVPGARPGDRVRFESVNNAIEQAKVAAYALTGRQQEYAGIPWFWSNQGSLKLQIAGLSAGHDRILVRRNEPGKLSVLYYRGADVIAADCINVPLDFMAVKAALGQRAEIPYDAAADPTIMLKTVMVAPHAEMSPS